VPNDPAHWALIGASGSYQVTLNLNVTLDRLDLTGSDAVLFTNGRTLTVLTNAGIGTPMGTSNTSVLRLAGSSFTGGGQIVIVYGLATGSTPTSSCAGVDYGIDAAQQVGTGFASVQGNALVSANIPAAAAGMTAYFQALDLTRCELTPVNSFVFP